MDYTNKKCPICHKEFINGDDIVVCPECGTPHHRECYNAENRCAFEDRHKEGFTYQEYLKEQNAQNDEQTENENIICPRCNAENPKNMFYCGKCGFPLNMQNTQNSYQQNTQNPQQPGNQPFEGQPFNMGGMGASPFDPMAGVNPETDMGDGVTAGEISKFVQKNTPYFMRVFTTIKDFSKGRFNFCAFLFSGGYLLYRKMYKIGTIITVLMILLMTAETYIQYSPVYTAFIDAVEKLATNNTTVSYMAMSYYYDAFYSLDLKSQIILGIMSLCSILTLVIQIVVGFMANKWYFKHCKKQVSKIKKENPQPQAALESKGGVNFALALSLYVVYLIINFIPGFIMGM